MAKNALNPMGKTKKSQQWLLIGIYDIPDPLFHQIEPLRKEPKLVFLMAALL